MSIAPPDPGRLTVGTDGSLAGATGSYTKRLGDMAGVYRDQAAYDAQVAERGPDALMYSVQEHRNVEDDGALIIGTSTLLPGRYGSEYAVTRGHLHARPNRAELYHCLSGSGVMLLETVDGSSEVIPLSAGQAVHVPGHWVHRSVNTGNVPFVTLFCYPADAGQNYSLIEEAGGMSTLIIDDGAGGWEARANPDHSRYRLTSR